MAVNVLLAVSQGEIRFGQRSAMLVNSCYPSLPGISQSRASALLAREFESHQDVDFADEREGRYFQDVGRFKRLQ